LPVSSDVAESYLLVHESSHKPFESESYEFFSSKSRVMMCGRVTQTVELLLITGLQTRVKTFFGICF